MDNLQITKENALKAYNNGCDDVKNVLANLFGKETFVPKSIIDRVKTFDDILAIKGITMGDISNLSDTEDELAYKKAKLIAEVYNEGTVLKWSDSSQAKYFPWFEWKSGFGLSYYYYVFWLTLTFVGSRLCFKSSALAIDAAKKFTDIYNKLLN